MKVAFLAPEFIPTWGGVGIYSVNLVRELCKDDDIDIHVITPRRGREYSTKRIEEMFNNRIRVHQVSTANDTFFYNLKFQLAILRKFGDLHRKYGFDILHSANLVHMPDIFLKFRKSPIPELVTAHTTIKGQVSGFLQSNKNFFKMAPSEKGSVLAYPIISVLEWFYLKQTKNLLTVSGKFAKGFRKKGYKGSVDVTHNGIVEDLFDYNSVNDPGTEFPELKNVKKPIVLFAGRLITQKGIETFVKAMSRLKDADVHFVIAGRGDVNGLNRLLRKYRIRKEQFTFLGFVDNHRLPGLYKLSSIFVLPSFYENFPISLLEAGAMKCCSIATNVGAVDEIINHRVNGIIIKPGDFRGLTNEINRLLEDEDDRKRMAKNAYDNVLTNFTSKIMAKKTKDIYLNLKK